MGGRSKLTVRLPDESLDFIKRYAAEHGLTVTEVLSRFLARLRQSTQEGTIHPKVDRISGLLPADLDVEALYADHIIEKHR
jgi:hypothetical protein